MTPTQAANSTVLSEITVARVVSLLMESRHQIEDMTTAVRDAIAAIEDQGRDRTRDAVFAAVARLRSVKALLDTMDDWATVDRLGFVADQARSVRDLCDAASAQFEAAARLFASVPPRRTAIFL